MDMCECVCVCCFVFVLFAKSNKKQTKNCFAIQNENQL